MIHVKHRQSGIALLGYLIAGAAVLAALAGLVWAWNAYLETVRQEGRNQKQIEWDQANEKARAAAAAERERQEAAAREASRALITAETAARAATQRWKELRDARPPLTTCDAPARPTALVEGDKGQPQPADRPPDRVRFTSQFVRLYDGAWTGPDGQPVFRDPGGSAEGTAGPGLPDADRLLDVHAENATRASETRRQLLALIALIRRLQAAPSSVCTPASPPG